MLTCTEETPITPPMTPARKQPDTSTYAGRFAVRLREMRKEAGLTVEELSEKSGIPPTTIYGWESGNHSPILNQLPNLAAGLGLADIGNMLPKE